MKSNPNNQNPDIALQKYDIVNAKPAQTEWIWVPSRQEKYHNASRPAVQNEFQLGLEEFRPIDEN